MNETPLELSTQRGQPQRALARWDGEGGAGPDGPRNGHVSGVSSYSAIGPLEVDRQEPRLEVTAQGSADQIVRVESIRAAAHASQADGHAGSGPGSSPGKTVPVQA